MSPARRRTNGRSGGHEFEFFHYIGPARPAPIDADLDETADEYDDAHENAVDGRKGGSSC
ncbi:hypothetical protein AB0L97_32775 [Nocardia sp. NPDC051911]|uniref:hypothetical protein n=1 Tax=Nocardia sp. NPDC051911 TaxID=3154648 RepID=UPI0034420E5B